MCIVFVFYLDLGFQAYCIPRARLHLSIGA